MGRLIASSLAAITLALGMPQYASANGTVASVLGQIVDAGGRGSSAATVELVKDGAVIGTAVTGFDGRFMMTGIAPGTYVVRTIVNGRTAGVRVSLKGGESVPVTVVLPSMVSAAAQAQFASLLTNLVTTVGGTTMATVVSEVAEAAAEQGDFDQVEETARTGAALVKLLDALQTAITTNAAGTGNASLTADQVRAVANVIVQIAVSLPPTVPTEIQQSVTTFLNQTAVTIIQQNPITVPGGTGGTTPTPVTVTLPTGPVFTGSATQ